MVVACGLYRPCNVQRVAGSYLGLYVIIFPTAIAASFILPQSYPMELSLRSVESTGVCKHWLYCYGRRGCTYITLNENLDQHWLRY